MKPVTFVSTFHIVLIFHYNFVPLARYGWQKWMKKKVIGYWSIMWSIRNWMYELPCFVTVKLLFFSLFASLVPHPIFLEISPWADTLFGTTLWDLPRWVFFERLLPIGCESMIRMIQLGSFLINATLASRPDGGFRHPRHPGMQQHIWLLVPQTGTNCPKFGHQLMD